MNQISKRKKNQGFSLLTVIVAVAFIGILGMLILYIAMANFQMKITDLKGKDSFYTAEKAAGRSQDRFAGGCWRGNVYCVYQGS